MSKIPVLIFDIVRVIVTCISVTLYNMFLPWHWKRRTLHNILYPFLLLEEIEVGKWS